MIEGEVLEVPLDAGHAEAMGDRGVDLQRLARDPPPRLGRHVLQGRHVVQPVGELDDDHPDVARRGEDHLAEGLGLGLVAPHVLVAADLGDAVHQPGDLAAELGLQHLAGGQRVLEHVVQQPHRDAGLVEVEVGQQEGDVERMDHVRLAGAADLVLVHAGGEVVDRAQELRVHGTPMRGETRGDVFDARGGRRRDRGRDALAGKGHGRSPARMKGTALGGLQIIRERRDWRFPDPHTG